MIPFVREPDAIISTPHHPIYSFKEGMTDQNIDHGVVNAFGEEWTRFNSFTDEEINQLGQSYFDILDPGMLNEQSRIIDFGAGSGRFSFYLAPKVRFIDLLEPSDAIYVANALLRHIPNVRLTQCSIGASPYEDEAYDFAMSVGVLHHMPDTKAGMQQCIRKVKPMGWFYVYLYYKLDHRGFLFKSVFFLVTAMRWGVSRLPFRLKKYVCDGIAILCYMPVIMIGRMLNALSLTSWAEALPLRYYQDKSFHIIRNDALDRFGTRIEHRFSKEEIIAMMQECGLSQIRVSDSEPYWHAVGQKVQ